MRVLTFGWYGAGNLGDEMLFRLFKTWAEAEGAEVRAISVDPSFTREQHGVHAVDFHDLAAVAREMQQADLFALGGGGLFQTYHPLTIPALYDFTAPDVAAYARPVLMARQFGVPTLAWAQGVGPLDTPDGRAIVREVFGKVDTVSVRDPGSAALLNTIGVTRDIVVAPDPVWAYPLPAASTRTTAARARRTIMIVVRPWQTDADWVTALVDAIAETNPESAEWLWVPASWNDVPGRASSDATFIESLVSRLPRHEHSVAQVSSPGDVLELLSAADGCISMRLHAQIAALRYGIPTLCLEYDAKMSVASDDAGLPDECRLSMSDTPALWRERVGLLVSGLTPVASAGAIVELGEAALMHRDVLGRALHGAANKRPEWNSDGIGWLQLWEQKAREIAARQREDRILAIAADWSARLDQTQSTINRLTSQFEEEVARNRRLDEAITKNHELEGVLARDRAELSRLASQLEVERARAADLDARLRAQQQEAAMKANDVEALTRAVERQARLTREALRRHEEDRAAISALQAQLRESDRERARLQQDADYLQRSLSDMYRSTSWRITSPLRAIKSRLFGAPAAPDANQLTPVTRPSRTEVSLPLQCAPNDLSWPEFANTIIANRDQYRGIFIQEVVIDWNVPLFQRPQHMAAAMARRGYLVIYKTVNWTGDDVDGFREVAPNVWLTNRAEVDGLDRVVRSVYSTAYADDPANLVRRPASSVMVYEYIDHIDPQISGDDANIQRLLELKDWGFKHADFVVASARQLEAEAIESVGRDRVLFVPNGVDTRHYRDETHLDYPLPIELERFVASHQAVVGYFGALAPWLWYDVIGELVASRPELGFVFIGPDYYGGAARLPDAPNVLQLGAIDYRVLPAFARTFDVCFIPFAPGEIARTTSPLKLFEYFALEKPVVVSDEMRECTVYPEVLRGGDASSLSAAIDDALARSSDDAYRDRLRTLADENDWDRRAAVLEQAFNAFTESNR